MAWHGFLAHFLLWAEVIYHASQAAWLLLGRQYDLPELRETVYAGLPGLRLLDLGLILIAAVAAVLCVCGAVALHRRSRSGPRILRVMYLMLAAGQIGSAAGRYFIAGLTPVSPSALGQAILYLALMWMDGSYYGKRRDMFLKQTGGKFQ